jgi:hypothetical protein
MYTNLYVVTDRRSTGERRVVFQAREPGEAVAVATLLSTAGDCGVDVELVHADEVELVAA